MRKALVLGAAGFIGSHLVVRLARDGWHVTGIVRKAPAGRASARIQDLSARCRLVYGDAGDQSLLKREVEDVEAIFPCAGRSGAPRSMEEPLADLAANVGPMLSLLEAIRHRNPASRLIVPGSRLQYGRATRIPVDESHAQLPTSLYGAHKALAEHYGRIYSERYDMTVTSLRISNPYGPGQDRVDRAFGLVGSFLALASSGRTINVYGGGTQLRDYIFIDDLIDLFVRAASTPSAGMQVYNAGGPRPVSVAEMARAVVRVVGKGTVVEGSWPVTDLAIETGDYVSDIGRAREGLGWVPLTDLDEGLRIVWDAMPSRER